MCPPPLLRGSQSPLQLVSPVSVLHLQGFNQEDLEGDKKVSTEKKQQVEEESDSDEGVDRSGQE